MASLAGSAVIASEPKQSIGSSARAQSAGWVERSDTDRHTHPHTISRNAKTRSDSADSLVITMCITLWKTCPNSDPIGYLSY